MSNQRKIREGTPELLPSPPPSPSSRGTDERIGQRHISGKGTKTLNIWTAVDRAVFPVLFHPRCWLPVQFSLSLFLSFLVEWDKMEYFVGIKYFIAINCKTIWMFCVDLEFECVTYIYIYIYKVNFCINWALKIFRIKSDWKAFENFSYCMGSK